MKILVIEDEATPREELISYLEGRGHKCTELARGEDIDKVKDLQKHKLAIIDYGLGVNRWNGMRTGYEIHQKAPGMKLLMLTANFTDPQLKRDALHGDFHDFLGKYDGFSVLEKHLTETKDPKPAKNSVPEQLIPELLGQSVKFLEALDYASRVAKSNLPVLILGEPGTGKEGFAREIHNRSLRSAGPFIAVNCAAFPNADALRSEIFGHVPGSYTSAVGSRDGCFELADKGTLFLDEVGHMAPEVQNLLLRALQEGTFTKYGGSDTIKASVRIISASNKDIAAMVKGGEFAKDLFGRIGVVDINLPPLRERGDDVILLAESIIDRYQKNEGDKRDLVLSDDAKQTLREMQWGNNVRGLKSSMELTCLLFSTNAKKKNVTVILSEDFKFAASENMYHSVGDELKSGELHGERTDLPFQKQSQSESHGTKNIPAPPDVSLRQAGPQDTTGHAAGSPVVAPPAVLTGSIVPPLTIKDVADYLKLLRSNLHDTLDGSRGQIMFLADEMEELKKDIWEKVLSIPEVECPRQAILFLYGKGVIPEGKKLKNKAGGVLRVFNVLEAEKNKNEADRSTVLRYPDFKDVADLGPVRGTTGKNKK